MNDAYSFHLRELWEKMKDRPAAQQVLKAAILASFPDEGPEFLESLKAGLYATAASSLNGDGLLEFMVAEFSEALDGPDEDLGDRFYDMIQTAYDELEQALNGLALQNNATRPDQHNGAPA